MRSDDLFPKVVDRNSFIEFVRALAEEREAAVDIERSNTTRYSLDAANGWKNATIHDFLYAALDYFDEKPFHKPEAAPSWKMFADFLYHGKIIE